MKSNELENVDKELGAASITPLLNSGADTQWYRPLRSGIQIGFPGTVGTQQCTLGPLVHDSNFNYFFLTSAHNIPAGSPVVHQPRGPVIRNSSQEVNKYNIGTIRDRDASLDVALIALSPSINFGNWVVGLGSIKGTYTVTSADLPFAVHCRGYSSGYAYGHITQIDSQTGVLTLDFDLVDGDSGAPLVDDSGRLIGIVNYRTTTRTTYGVPIDRICERFSVTTQTSGMPWLFCVRNSANDFEALKYSTLNTENMWTDPLNWNFPSPENKYSSSFMPAFVNYGVNDDKLLFVANGAGDNRLYSAEFDGTGIGYHLINWPALSLFPNSNYILDGMGSPSLAAFRGRIYLARRSTNNSAYISIACFDGAVWDDLGEKLTTYDSEDGAPNLVVYKDQLYCLRRSDDCSIMVGVWDGASSNWSDSKLTTTGNIGGVCYASGRIGVATHDGKLYCMWEQQGNTGVLQCAVYDGNTWRSITNFQAATTGGPSLISHNEKLLCFHRGSGNSNDLWCLTFDGLSWADAKIPRQNKPYQSRFAPALFVLPKRLTSDDQWYFCSLCNGLFQNSFLDTGICPGSDNGSSGHVIGCTAAPMQKRYSLLYNSYTSYVSTGFKRCVNCSGLFFKNDKVGWCPISRNSVVPHVAGGRFADYLLTNTVAGFPGEPNWRECVKCTGVFYTASGGLAGSCPAGSTHNPKIAPFSIQYWNFTS